MSVDGGSGKILSHISILFIYLSMLLTYHIRTSSINSTPKKKLSKKEKIMMLQPVRSSNDAPSPSASTVASPTTTTPKNKLPSPSPKKNLARQQQPDRLAARTPKPSFTKR